MLVGDGCLLSCDDGVIYVFKIHRMDRMPLPIIVSILNGVYNFGILVIILFHCFQLLILLPLKSQAINLLLLKSQPEKSQAIKSQAINLLWLKSQAFKLQAIKSLWLKLLSLKLQPEKSQDIKSL